KEKDLIDAFLRGQVDRRGLIKGLGAMGLAAGTAGTLLNLGQTRALAADFDWQSHKGKTIKLLLNKHPYADAMIANLEN
ncbi:MAG: twin-arginine translocation signal domain-containing protein, partial [Mesorhizobium sp.]